MLWVTSYYFLYRTQHNETSFDKITELSWSHNQIFLLSSVSSWLSYISASSWCLDTSVTCRYLSGNIVHGLFTGIQILQWKVQDIISNYWWVATASGFGNHQEPVKQQHLCCFTYSGKQSYMEILVYSELDSFLLHRLQKRQLEKTKILFPSTDTEPL